MNRKKRTATVIALLLVGAAVVSLFFSRIVRYAPTPWAGDPFAGRELRCALNIGRFDDSTRILISGYNYALLKEFAREIGATVSILPARDRSANLLDSLRAGSLDILVLPCKRGKGAPEGTLSSVPIDSLSVWLVKETNLHGLRDINAWLKKYARSPLHNRMERVYIQALYDPFQLVENGKTRKELSPYDSLYKAYAPSLGWDWRMLAALSFKESKFRIDAHSHMNAFGLMQVGESTAAKYGLVDQMDPEGNIRTGVKYLSFLQGVFAKRLPEGASSDLTKMVLAAYNGGEGRLLDCIDFAQQLNAYDSTWACLLKLPALAEMSHVQTDSLNMRKYNMEQISQYVNDVLDTYAAFRTICP